MNTIRSVFDLVRSALRGDELSTIADIARAYDISKNHPMKVAHELGAQGFVETVRGNFRTVVRTERKSDKSGGRCRV
jgi:DNA-binding IscR family transcriptional regulator